ncbi:CAP domain-containing protein [Bacillus songklensis]|uniref:CAP domain-containing protein n=1 Tax=Bacillus songklensis TaxID=1069116 RepID=A0ABV8B743_9BACI
MKKTGTILAAAALATTIFAGGANANAAAPTPTNCQTYVYSVNGQAVNSAFLQQLLNKYGIQFTVNKAAVPTVQQPAQKPAPTVQQPAQKAKPTTSAQQPATKTQKPATTTSSSVSEFEKQVANLVNQERQKAGLKPLQLDTKLSDVAREKSRDMMNKGYFDHQSPTYGSPFDMMKQFGITYRAAGENIAKGQQTPQEVMNAWMNSEGHRANILNGSFTHIGVGFVKDSQGTTYWTQMFIGK